MHGNRQCKGPELATAEANVKSAFRRSEQVLSYQTALIKLSCHELYPNSSGQQKKEKASRTKHTICMPSRFDSWLMQRFRGNHLRPRGIRKCRGTRSWRVHEFRLLPPSELSQCSLPVPAPWLARDAYVLLLSIVVSAGADLESWFASSLEEFRLYANDSTMGIECGLLVNQESALHSWADS